MLLILFLFFVVFAAVPSQGQGLMQKLRITGEEVV